MPKLDQLYREHKNQGFLVFGLSEEDPATQRKGLAKIPVTYPLLTYDGQIPSLSVRPASRSACGQQGLAQTAAKNWLRGVVLHPFLVARGEGGAASCFRRAVGHQPVEWSARVSVGREHPLYVQGPQNADLTATDQTAD